MTAENNTTKLADVIDFASRVEKLITKQGVSPEKVVHCNRICSYIYRKKRDVVLRNLYKNGA